MHSTKRARLVLRIVLRLRLARDRLVAAAHALSVVFLTLVSPFVILYESITNRIERQKRRPR